MDFNSFVLQVERGGILYSAIFMNKAWRRWLLVSQNTSHRRLAKGLKKWVGGWPLLGLGVQEALPLQLVKPLPQHLLRLGGGGRESWHHLGGGGDGAPPVQHMNNVTGYRPHVGIP